MADITYGTSYVKTIPGILKIIEILFAFMAVILVLIKGWSEPLQDAFIIGTAVGTVVSFVLLLMYITKLAESLGRILCFQCFYYLIWFIYLLIVSSILMSKQYSEISVAAGVFGLLASFSYLADAFISFRLETPPCF